MKRKIVFSIGALNESLRVKRILQGTNIVVNVIKLDEARSKNGCSYGIEFRETDLYSIVHTLTSHGIHYNSYYDLR